MTEKIIRGMFFFACVLMGGLWAQYIADIALAETGQDAPWWWMVVGGLIGGGVATVVLLMLHFITQELYERIAPALVSIVLAMVVGYFAGQYLLWWFGPEVDVTLRVFVVVTLVLLCGFGGISIGLTRASNWESLIEAVERTKGGTGSLKIVDTSVLIDGRIADIVASGFIEGTLMVPQFVLHEMQHIADSSDVLRRAKGRRGLDILKDLQEQEARIAVEITEEDPRDVREVDAKLVKLASKYKAKVMTTDFNLNKVAQIEGVEVLNINDLANALKPAVLPDEMMTVKIIKEGKEPNQGVGYLDDGTMIVVDGGRSQMGKTIRVVVTSVLQTAAGRMIFARLDEAGA